VRNIPKRYFRLLHGRSKNLIPMKEKEKEFCDFKMEGGQVELPR
jgi:hypothetical protein